MESWLLREELGDGLIRRGVVGVDVQHFVGPLLDERLILFGLGKLQQLFSDGQIIWLSGSYTLQELVQFGRVLLADGNDRQGLGPLQIFGFELPASLVKLFGLSKPLFT